MKKIVCLILIMALSFTVLSGCSTKVKTTEYNVNEEHIDSAVVAENENLTLSFDSENNTVSLFCKTTGKTWSNNPDMNDERSTFTMRVQDTRTNHEDTYESYDAKVVSSKKIENGVELTYYYHLGEEDKKDKQKKDVKISVPVCYVLRDDSLQVSVDGSNIQHGEERFQLIAVSPSPFLCSSAFESEEEAYLFLPYGIGGIVDTEMDADGKDEFLGTGSNIASMAIESFVNSPDSSGFKCFGVKEGSNALFCIAEGTPDAVGYKSIRGDITLDFSYVSPDFYFSDYDYFYGKTNTDGQIKQVSDMYLGTVSVGFYPLYNEKADYIGMAECYRDYLTESGYITENGGVATASPYSVTYLGGVLTSTSTLGIPNKKLNAMTTFGEAKSITEELYSVTGLLPEVRISGYGETGINIGKIAGGYDFASNLGSEKERKDLEEYIEQLGKKVYTDFGLMYYSKSGNGFSYSRNAAKTAVLHAAEKSPANVALRDFNTDLKYRLLSRGLLSEAVDKLADMIDKKQLSAVSLNDLGSVSYSDYGEGTKYAVSADMEKDTKNYIERLKATGVSVGVSKAKFYAAGLSDTVFDAPLEPCGRYIYANEIPFYQIVFHGLVPMYSSAVNTSVNADYKLMLAASTGTGLGFTLINDFDSSYMEADQEKLYAMVYSGNKELISEALAKYKDIYEAVKTSKISGYDILDGGITKTTFENGRVIYANHTSSEVESPVGALGGYEFVMEGGEG